MLLYSISWKDTDMHSLLPVPLMSTSWTTCSAKSTRTTLVAPHHACALLNLKLEERLEFCLHQYQRTDLLRKQDVPMTLHRTCQTHRQRRMPIQTTMIFPHSMMTMYL